ncbi:MAG: hypothetical protein Q9226_006213 [Calogaya cf. arnoldii]
MLLSSSLPIALVLFSLPLTLHAALRNTPRAALVESQNAGLTQIAIKSATITRRIDNEDLFPQDVTMVVNGMQSGNIDRTCNATGRLNMGFKLVCDEDP